MSQPLPPQLLASQPLLPTSVPYEPTTPASVPAISTTPASVTSEPTTPTSVPYEPTTPASAPAISTTPASVTSEPTTPPGPPKQNSHRGKKNRGEKLAQPGKEFTRLVTGIERELPTVVSVQSHDSNLIISPKRSCEDVRLDHIRMVTGDTGSSVYAKLRRVLALRSLAAEYTARQRENGISVTRIDELCNHIKFELKTSVSQRRFAGREFYDECVAIGLKHMAVERCLASHLNGGSDPRAVSSISLVLALNITSFERIPFYEIPDLLRTIASKQVQLERDKPQLSLAVLYDLTPWLRALQTAYESE
ncbi:hypothetical protein N7493_000952 [Penicillium malachiteum]|uniref:Uncharacterized protein n=1 Tax=Penicillium malachiteum TaxID=1324776 RepID=A0AAD6HXC7_9EURO|nr:hypothetical protein N7493_000952 [Penicillium malachiteum]